MILRTNKLSKICHKNNIGSNKNQKLNDLKTVLWLNSFLESYRNSPEDMASINKWFKSTDWMNQVEEEK